METTIKNELQAEAARLGYNMTIESVEVDGIKRVIILQDPLDVMSDAAQWLGERFDNVTISTFNACRVTALEKLREVFKDDEFTSHYRDFPVHNYKVTEVTKRRVSYISTDPGATTFEYSKSRKEFEEHLRGSLFQLKEGETFEFWRDNKVANAFNMPVKVASAKFAAWLKEQKHKDGFTKEWLENLGSLQCVIMFVGDPLEKLGLQSVAEQATYDELQEVIKDSFWTYVNSL